MGERENLRGYFVFVNLLALFAILAILLSIMASTASGDNQTGNQTASPSPTIIPILITNVSVGTVDNASAQITWQTDQFSNSTAYYQVLGFGNPYQIAALSDNQTSHSIQINSLNASTNYSAYVQSCDANSCMDTTSSPAEFTTLANQAPEVSPSPSISPSPSPSTIPSPSASIIPSPSPSISPSPSVSPSPSLIPSPSPTISPSASVSPTPIPSNQSQNKPQLPLGPESSSACGSEGAHQSLTSAVVAVGSCYNITAAGVIFNCVAFNITGNMAGFGINVTGQNDVVIKNCVISNFSVGIYAVNARNLTITNVTFVNITGTGIMLNNSFQNNITDVLMRDSGPFNISSAPGTNSVGIYFNNVTNTTISIATFLRLKGGAPTTSYNIAGNAFGMYLANSQNLTINKIFISNLVGSPPSTCSTTSGCLSGGNATGMYLQFLNFSVITNITVNSMQGYTGPTGPSSATAPKTGGVGGYGQAFYLFNSSNNQMWNLTATLILGGFGGYGGSFTGPDGNGADGGPGGDAIGMFTFSGQNNTVNNYTVYNLSGGDGGFGEREGGDSGHTGTGGAGGNVVAYELQHSIYNSINLVNSTLLRGGKGGISDYGAVPSFPDGAGGNATGIRLFRSLNTTISNVFINTTNGGDTQLYSNNLSATGGGGFGIFFEASNWTTVHNLYIPQLSAGRRTTITYFRTAGVQFWGSAFNLIGNSTINVTFRPPNSFSVYSEGSSFNNVFQNTTLNKSSMSWKEGIGVNNVTVTYFMKVNVTSASGQVNNAQIRSYNVSSATQLMGSTSTDSSGINYVQVIELHANGTFTYSSFCGDQANLSCYTPHFFIVNSTTTALHYVANSTMNVSRSALVWQCGNVTASYTMPGNVTNAASTCYTLGLQNLEFDCANYALVGDQAQGSAAIFSQSVKNITVKNCYITNWSRGVIFNFTANSFLLNNSFIDNLRNGAYSGTTNIVSIFVNNSPYINMTKNRVHRNNATSSYSTFPTCSAATSTGVYMSNSSNAIIYYLNVSETNGLAYGSDGESCSLKSTSGTGLSLTNMLNATIAYSDFSSNKAYGISTSVVNTSIIQHTATSSNLVGVYASLLINSSLINMTANSNPTAGFQFISGSYNSSIINSTVTYSTRCIILDSNNHTIENNTINYCIAAINLNQDSVGNVLSNNKISHSYSSGGSIFGAINLGLQNHYTKIFGNTVFNTTDPSANGVFSPISVYGSSNINMTNNNLTNSSVYGVYIDSSSSVNFTDGFIALANSNDFFVAGSSNVIIVNSSFNRSRIEAYNDVKVGWYGTFNITNSTNNPLPSAVLNITNSSGGSYLNTLANSNGLLDREIFYEFTVTGAYTYQTDCIGSTGSIVCHSPYNVTASQAGYDDNMTTWNLSSTQNRQIYLYLASASSTGFTLTLPGQSPVTANTTTHPGSPLTGSMNFTLNPVTYKEGTQTDVVPCVSNTASCQTTTVPFFNYTNVGTVLQNWTIHLNDTLPSYLRLKCGNTNVVGNALTIANSTFNSAVQVNNGTIATGTSQHAWCWADFTNALGGTIARTLEHNSTAT